MSTESLRRLGKYELQERLGHGGMAEVWKARDTQLQRYVAIKLLHANLQADPNFVTRFQNEAQAIASLRHPNIVQIHDFQVSLPPESDSPTPYMVMAYIEGRTLADYIANTSARGKIPSPVEIVNLFTSISLAVDYAHQKGMIHRDIKPANILLDKHNTARNPMGEPILTDFGLAKLLGVSASALSASLGTPLYTSPEQARGYPGNERSDLYSLGIILYEMVTGAQPFRGDSPPAVLSQQINVTPTSPVLLNPNIPPALTMVIMTALAKDPNARFSRATIMAAAIAEALNVPLPESLSQFTYSADMRSMPTYVGSPTSQIGAGTSPSSAPSTAGIPQVTQPSPTSQPNPATPASWQPYMVSAPAGTVPISSHPTPPLVPTLPGSSGPLARQPERRWKGLYTILVLLVVLALLGSGLGAYFVFFHKANQPVAAQVPGGQAFFLSSGQYDFGTSQGIADMLQIELRNSPAAQPGKSYYAWLLADKQPHVEQPLLEPAPPFKLPLLLGRLPVNNGSVSFPYTAPNHYNLISVASRLLITEEDTNGTPSGPAANRSAWRYYAEIPQTPYGNPALSALDHIRHLFYKETKVDVLGLAGGLDVWLLRNTEKVLEWSISARNDYHTQISDPADIHSQFLRILDYLDGSPNVQVDVPAGSPILADQTISRVALLTVPAQRQLTDLAHDPPGYLDHIQLHLNGVVSAPDATSQMRTLAAQIIESLNNAKIWLQQVRADAKQLIQMNATQLSQPSTLNMLNDLLSNATYAYIGQLNPRTNQVVPGVLEAHYDVQRLGTLTITSKVPQNI